MTKTITIDEKKIFNLLYSHLEPNYTLTYLDYRDELQPDMVYKCLKDQSLEPIYEKDYWGEARMYYAKNELENIIDKYLKDKYTKDEIELFRTSQEYQALFDYILDRDNSNPELELFKRTNTRAKIMLHSNYDCWIPAYEQGNLCGKEDALAGMMTALSLNPAKVKEEASKRGISCVGFHNIKTREGREVVSYKDFVDCLENATGYGLWTFFGYFDMDALLEKKFNTKELMIPKGTRCTIFNDWNGSGSMTFAETIRDISLKELFRKAKTKYDIPAVYVDEKFNGNSYTSGEVYGDIISRNKILTI